MITPSGTGETPIPKPSSEPFEMVDGHASTTQTPKISLYEQSRELRIKENLERMQKLGIVDLSLKLKSSTPPKQNRRKSLNLKASLPQYEVPPTGPVRRSSRLQNVTPVSYSEVQMEKKNKSAETEGVMLEEGAKPELYSEEHEKLLGNTEKSWTLFVDGYGKDGRRIYDPVKGKTCHQCRQKTLGQRTQCCKCNMVQGQFCGDCLYMRYGEHVLEAQQNPNWICPVCRGICNCSLCRQAKGWLPTGPLYKKIARMGFKSVAHFLIQTRQSQPSSGQESTDLVSAKKSLSFTGFEVIPPGSPKVNDNVPKTLDQHFENNAGDEFDNEGQNILYSISNCETKDHISVKRSLNFSCLEQDSEEIEPSNLNHENDELSLPNLQSEEYKFGEDNNEKEKELHCMKRKNDDNYSPFETCSVPEKKMTLAVESNTNFALLTDQSLEKKTDISGQTTSESITGQLRSEYELSGVAEKTLAVQQSSEDPVSGSKRDKKLQNGKRKLLDTKCGADPDSIDGKVRKMRKSCNSYDGNESPIISERNVGVKQENKKPHMVSNSSPDCIVGKIRHEQGNGKSKDDGFLQETSTKTSEEGVDCLSWKNTEAPVKLPTSPEQKYESIGRRLRPRQKPIQWLN